jgi:hypothetical protein
LKTFSRKKKKKKKKKKIYIILTLQPLKKIKIKNVELLWMFGHTTPNVLRVWCEHPRWTCGWPRHLRFVLGWPWPSLMASGVLRPSPGSSVGGCLPTTIKRNFYLFIVFLVLEKIKQSCWDFSNFDSIPIRAYFLSPN